MRKYIALIILLTVGILSTYGQDKYFIYENTDLKNPATKDKGGSVSEMRDTPKYIITKESWKF